MYSNSRELEYPMFDLPLLTDMITGETVQVVSPSSFILETVLINTAYYRVADREYRFRLPDARIAGLPIEKEEY